MDAFALKNYTPNSITKEHVEHTKITLLKLLGQEYSDFTKKESSNNIALTLGKEVEIDEKSLKQIIKIAKKNGASKIVYSRFPWRKKVKSGPDIH